MAEDHPIPTDALAGLADRWESFAPIRQRKAVVLNADVLRMAATSWVDVFDFEGSGSRPKTPPVRPTVEEVRNFYKLMLGEGIDLDKSKKIKIYSDDGARQVARVFMAAWYPSQLAAWEEPDSLDCIPWGSDESLDDETFEAMMDVHESGDAPLPDPAPHHHVANPNDPANMDTLPSDPSEWGAVLGGPDRPSPDSPPEVAVEYIDAAIPRASSRPLLEVEVQDSQDEYAHLPDSQPGSPSPSQPAEAGEACEKDGGVGKETGKEGQDEEDAQKDKLLKAKTLVLGEESEEEDGEHPGSPMKSHAEENKSEPVSPTELELPDTLTPGSPWSPWPVSKPAPEEMTVPDTQLDGLDEPEVPMSQPETQPDHQDENDKVPEVEMSQPETQPDHQDENDKVPEVEMSQPETRPDYQDESDKVPEVEMSQPETQPDHQDENDKVPEVEMSQHKTRPDYQDENDKVPEVEMSQHETQPDYQGKNEKVPEVEMSQPETKTTPQEHHILDELENKYLRRAEQDALRWAPQEDQEDGRGSRGRGRGRGKGRGKGKGKGKGRKGRGKGESKPKSRKGVRRALQPELEESVGSDSCSVHATAGSDLPQPTPKKAAKAPKRAAKAKASPKNKSKQSKAKAAAKAKGAPKAKAAAKAKSAPAPAEGPRADAEDAAAPAKKLRGKKAHPVEIEIPEFNYATIVPYWSRNACALKMPELDNPSHITQSFYIASKKHDMKELISVSAEIASRFAYATLVDAAGGNYAAEEVQAKFTELKASLR
ncbi:unnamed protein product [Cladocopium goreaui]|uniref:Uncharacterized protein n=1 Tax=Cladocopium goreaui TaxID=2562237 RepID=A0A9P1GGT2_9DINO|nr:unnamed protein product [Cladocopium goreaui]